MLAKHQTLFVVLAMALSLIAAGVGIATYSKVSKPTPVVQYVAPVVTVEASPAPSKKPVASASAATK